MSLISQGRALKQSGHLPIRLADQSIHQTRQLLFVFIPKVTL